MATIKHFEVVVSVVLVDSDGRRTTVDTHPEQCDDMRTAKRVFDSAISGLVEASGAGYEPFVPFEPCKHDWQEQPGEPPVDVCIQCGEVRH